MRLVPGFTLNLPVKMKQAALHSRESQETPFDPGDLIDQQAFAREAIEKYFSQEIREGILEFKPLNVDEPENRHYIQDYQLYTRSLVLALYKDDKQLKWKNLSEIWFYVRDKEKFYQYVKDETERFLQEKE